MQIQIYLVHNIANLLFCQYNLNVGMKLIILGNLSYSINLNFIWSSDNWIR